MRAVLFDMDGVLVDVSCSYRLTIKKVVEYFLNRRISSSMIQAYKNRGNLNNDWDLTESILIDHGKKVEKQRIIDVFQQIYLGENFNGLIRNERWVLDMHHLENIRKKFKTGIVTGRPEKEAHYVLEKFGAGEYFLKMVTMDDVPPEKSKPDPFGIELALKLLDVQKGFYIGDTIDDMVAARKANVIPIGVINKDTEDNKQKDLLLKSGAQCVLFDINDILEVLE